MVKNMVIVFIVTLPKTMNFTEKEFYPIQVIIVSFVSTENNLIIKTFFVRDQSSKYFIQNTCQSTFKNDSFW